MKRLSLYLLLFLSIITSFTSCRKDIPEMTAPENYRDNDFSSVFEAFWTGMNHNYLFWDIDTTDWDRVYDQYKPLFASLDINSVDDALQAFRYFEAMTAGLVDGHYHLSFKKSPLQNAAISPSTARKKKEAGYHNPIPADYFLNTLPAHYFEDYYQGVTETEYGTLAAVSGKLQGDILYLYFSNFLFGQLNAYDPVAAVIEYFFNELKNANNLKGVIIDVRGNGGGSMADMLDILSRLINSRATYAYCRSKMGEGRLDYTPWTPLTVDPAPGYRVNVPIAVLADLHSASSAELLAMGVATLPNGYIVGEKTWGAQGPLADNAIYNGGQFSTAFMELVYTSSLITKYIDENIYEGDGFPPDYEVKYDENMLQTGIDPQLEKAIEIVEQSKSLYLQPY